MRFFAVTALVAGLVAAQDYDYGYGSEPQTIVLTSTDVQTITSCAGGCGAHSTPVPVVPVETEPVAPVETAPVAPVETLSLVNPVNPETCVPVTETVTVTIPGGVPSSPPTGVAPPPTAIPKPSAPFPTPSGPEVYPPHPTGTVSVPPFVPGGPSGTPTPSPPAFTGAATQANAGLFVAGAGAFAAFFL